MDEEAARRPERKEPTLGELVGASAARKLEARRHPTHEWSGLGMMGLVGWSVVVPTLLGAALGSWLDKHHPGHHAWTLALLVAGLVLGCVNAWRWVVKEEGGATDDGPDHGPHDGEKRND